MLSVRGLKKRFYKHQVLKGIDLDVGEGEVIGVIGSSGSGKSTMLRCLNFLETPEEGQFTLGDIFLDAATAKKQDILALRRSTAMVVQQFHLFTYKTALENVMEGLITVQRVPPDEARDIAEQRLTEVGLEDRMFYYPSQLSGGQRQRVAIARAVALRPKILLLDEPTSALDPEMVGEVLKVIKGLAKAGYTMIIVSHEMNFIYDTADRVLFLDDGGILEQGTPREVFLESREDRARQFLSSANLADHYNI